MHLNRKCLLSEVAHFNLRSRLFGNLSMVSQRTWPLHNPLQRLTWWIEPPTFSLTVSIALNLHPHPNQTTFCSISLFLYFSYHNKAQALYSRARWDQVSTAKMHRIVSGHMFFNVFFNFEHSFFSSTFWFERSFRCKIDFQNSYLTIKVKISKCSKLLSVNFNI